MNNKKRMKVHFVGIGGAGMSVLARFMKKKGYYVSGSDRDYDCSRRKNFFQMLQKEKIRLFPQDGSGIDKTIDYVITSTAIESSIVDIVKAKHHNIPIIHRSIALANQISHSKSIAVAGTSGKSTVTGMIGWILSQVGLDPVIINGAAIKDLGGLHIDLDFKMGHGDWIVFEADESDGSLVNFKPELGLILNISKDHKTINDLLHIFKKFAYHVRRELFINYDLLNIFHNIGHCNLTTFGFSKNADVKVSIQHIGKWSSTFYLEDSLIHLGVPGKHNILNAAAAFSVLRSMGITKPTIAMHLSSFKGIKRRFEKIGVYNEITFVDDYAHNPHKIKASISTAKKIAKRVLIIFQPHGFGPTKFLFNEYVQVFQEEPGIDDYIFLLPIYYAGGTVTKDISSDDMAVEISAKKRNVFVCDRIELLSKLKTIARSGDLILLMGARDPSLSDYINGIFNSLSN